MKVRAEGCHSNNRKTCIDQKVQLKLYSNSSEAMQSNMAIVRDELDHVYKVLVEFKCESQKKISLPH